MDDCVGIEGDCIVALCIGFYKCGIGIHLQAVVVVGYMLGGEYHLGALGIAAGFFICLELHSCVFHHCKSHIGLCRICLHNLVGNVFPIFLVVVVVQCSLARAMECHGGGVCAVEHTPVDEGRIGVAYPDMTQT